MRYALFTIRSKPEERWLIGKKKKGDITTQDICDTINEKNNTLEIWACDIEDLKLLEDREEIKEAFKQINNDYKIFM